MGIDLKGGVILVYEIDSAKQPDGGVSMDKLVAAVSRRVNPGGQKEVTKLSMWPTASGRAAGGGTRHCRSTICAVASNPSRERSSCV